MGLLDGALEAVGLAGSGEAEKVSIDNPYDSELGKALKGNVTAFLEDPRSSVQVQTLSALLGDLGARTQEAGRRSRFDRLAVTSGLTGGARARAEIGSRVAAQAARSDSARQFLMQLFSQQEGLAQQILGTEANIELGVAGLQQQANAAAQANRFAPLAALTGAAGAVGGIMGGIGSLRGANAAEQQAQAAMLAALFGTP